jgi:hypothetical protein
MNEVLNRDSTWENSIIPHGKCHNKTENKTTVSLCLNKILVEKARIHKLNLSRITEQALSSILDYLETQTIKTCSNFLPRVLLRKKLQGPVDQSGMIAAFARRKPRVQIPPGPLPFGYKSHM